MSAAWMPPWTTSSGRDAIGAWVDTALERLHCRRIAPLTLVQSWDLACLLRIDTDAGPLYFKAAAPQLGAPGEARHLISLMAQLPDAPIARPLIVDDLLGWMIVPDHGTTLRALPTLDRWEQAARQYAALQVASVDRAQALVQSGLTDLRGRRLFAELPLLFRHPRALEGLNDDEIDLLRRSSLRLTDLCIWLEAAALPPALVHGDLHADRIIDGTGRLIFTDWTYASVGLPFLDLTSLLDDAADLFEPAAVDRVRDAYLDGWSAYGSPGRLRAIYALAQPLGCLHQAIIHTTIADALDETAVSELTQAHGRARAADWLRRMLSALAAI